MEFTSVMNVLTAIGTLVALVLGFRKTSAEADKVKVDTDKTKVDAEVLLLGESREAARIWRELMETHAKDSEAIRLRLAEVEDKLMALAKEFDAVLLLKRDAVGHVITVRRWYFDGGMGHFPDLPQSLWPDVPHYLHKIGGGHHAGSDAKPQ